MTPRQKRPSSEALSRLTSGLAHELRNPLNSAKLQIAAIVRHEHAKDLSADVLSRLEAVDGELQRISDLVDDYLSLTEPRTIRPVEVSLGEVVDKAIAQSLRTIPKYRPQLQNRIPPEVPPVRADPERLKQVLVHILKNSLEAVDGRPQGRITVHARTTSSMVEVLVRDNGPGVPEELLETVLRPFVTTKAAGTGLGLSLVHELVTAHGGEVRIGRVNPGTEVSFTLPIAKP